MTTVYPSHQIASSTINEKVNEDLECLNTWLAGNKLSLNVAKTNSIVIGSRKKVKDIQQTSAMKPSLAIRDEDISMIEHTKYLGVHVDQYLSWDIHIADAVSAAPFGAFVALQKLQNRAARIVTNSPYRMSAPPIIRQLGWQTVKELIEIETVKMVYRSINHEAPEYLTGLFQRLSETCAR